MSVKSVKSVVSYLALRARVLIDSEGSGSGLFKEDSRSLTLLTSPTGNEGGSDIVLTTIFWSRGDSNAESSEGRD